MLLIAHGGYSAKYSENTKLAYDEALEFLPDGMEMDTCYFDGEVYFYHPVGNVNSFGEDVDILITEQLRGIVSVKAKIPKLSDDDIFKSYLKKVKFLSLDLKQKSLDKALKIFSKITEFGLHKEQIWVGVRDTNRVVEFNKFGVNVTLQSLDQDPNSYKKYLDLGVEYIRLWYKDISEELVEEIHKNGGKVIANIKAKIPGLTCRDSGNFTKETLLDVYKMGVDAVLVNDIEMARKYFPKK